MALLAAMLLAFAGAPSVAAAQGCDPCPPDCPMMQAAADGADHHGGGLPDEADPSVSACGQAVTCHAASPLPPDAAEAAAWRAYSIARHERPETLAPRSRPPDRRLRPPILL